MNEKSKKISTDDLVVAPAPTITATTVTYLQPLYVKWSPQYSYSTNTNYIEIKSTYSDNLQDPRNIDTSKKIFLI